MSKNTFGLSEQSQRCDCAEKFIGSKVRLRYIPELRTCINYVRNEVLSAGDRGCATVHCSGGIQKIVCVY